MRQYEMTHKGYIIKPHKTFPSNYIIVTEGQGGKIPKAMEGLFTRKDIAVAVIDKYEAVKEVVNDKARSKSGG